MIKLLKNLRWYDWLILTLITALLGVQVWIELMLPDYMGEIVGGIQGTIIDGKFVKFESTGEIWNIGFKMLGIVATSISLTVVTSLLAALVATRLARNLRKKVFAKVNGFSMEEINKFSMPSLITRTTNDISQVQQVAGMLFRMALYAPMMAIMAIIKILNKSPQLSVATAIAVGCMFIIILVIVFAVVPKFKKIQKLTDRLNEVTRENLTGLRVVRANSAEKLQKEKFEEVNSSYTKLDLFVNRVSGIIHPGMSFIMSGLSLAIVWISAYIVNDNPAFVPTMMTFMQYSAQVLFSFIILSILFVFLPRGAVSAKRINEVLNTEAKIKDGNLSQTESEKIGEVEFKNVNFKYPNAEDNILYDISFTAKRGETVAFIGSTGSGKSTLINLIPRFYDVTEGEILINGIDVRKYTLHDLHGKIGYVPQQGVLFSGSIKENIQYGKNDAMDEEINNALYVAQAGFVFSDLEEGIEHHISQGGKNVSGGQKQRLSIARAIVKNPEIYIFDDSFSALDYKTDKTLRKALKSATKNATNLIVAQRIGTIIDADKIIVLDKGRMVGMGTHKQLIKNCEVYREIAFSQLSKEELEDGE